LLGEHTDWAGGFRRFNKELCPGFTLVTGTNQGLYARVKKHPSKLVVSSTDLSGSCHRIELSMDAETLLREAREGGHFSYVAGVAYKMLEENKVGGLEIDNYRTTLPLGKGLSSSAAICVLTARAFNQLYDLRLTVRGEMEYAYQGELITPSQCGRLDQACAFGSTPVLMTYDGEFTSVQKLAVAFEVHMVIIDLCAQKDTTEILAALQGAYPSSARPEHRKLQEFLGAENQERVERAMKLLSGGSGLPPDQALAALGQLYSETQCAFDAAAGPLCPTQLTAPVLHKCLHHESLQPHIYGGKGDGSWRGRDCSDYLQKCFSSKYGGPNCEGRACHGPNLADHQPDKENTDCGHSVRRILWKFISSKPGLQNRVTAYT